MNKQKPSERILGITKEKYENYLESGASWRNMWDTAKSEAIIQYLDEQTMD